MLLKDQINIWSDIDSLYSKEAIILLQEKGYKVNNHYVDYEEEDNDFIYSSLKRMTEQEDPPFIFVGDKFIGSLKELKDLDSSGELASMAQDLKRAWSTIIKLIMSKLKWLTNFT